MVTRVAVINIENNERREFKEPPMYLIEPVEWRYTNIVHHERRFKPRAERKYHKLWTTTKRLLEFFLNVSLNSANSMTKIVIAVKGLVPATSWVRDQDATTAPARYMWEKGSLNQAQFMLQWLSISLNSVKVLLHLGKLHWSRLL